MCVNYKPKKVSDQNTSVLKESTREVPPGTLWQTLADSGRLWQALDDSGTLWHTLAVSQILTPNCAGPRNGRFGSVLGYCARIERSQTAVVKDFKFMSLRFVDIKQNYIQLKKNFCQSRNFLPLQVQEVQLLSSPVPDSQALILANINSQ